MMVRTSTSLRNTIEVAMEKAFVGDIRRRTKGNENIFGVRGWTVNCEWILVGSFGA